MRQKAGNIIALKNNFTAGGTDSSTNQIEYSALSCAIWTDNPQNLFFVQMEIQLTDRCQATETLA